jgi:hypothetical protein
MTKPLLIAVALITSIGVVIRCPAREAQPI